MMCSSIASVTWEEAEIYATVMRQCPCGINDTLIAKLMGSRRCEGSYSSGAEWMDPQCNNCSFTQSLNDLCRLTQVRLSSLAYVYTISSSPYNSCGLVFACLLMNVHRLTVQPSWPYG